MRIVDKVVIDLTPHEVKQCKSLSFRDNGLMSEDLAAWRRYDSYPNRRRKKARVFMMRDDDNRLIAWCLLVPNPRKGYTAEFYTRVTERGKGYASQLMALVKEYDPTPYVMPHDRRSGAFFKKHRDTIRIDKYDEDWLT